MTKFARLLLLAPVTMLALSCHDPGDGGLALAPPPVIAPVAGDTEMTVTIWDIPGRYGRGGISLWGENGAEFGSHAGVVADGSLTVTFSGGAGLYDAILSLWNENTDGHWRIWSLSLTPGANTVTFGDFVEFTD
ncbi:MAG: hypothetical protein FWB79_00820 [Treponema sp.]|nr:hypothetical protein [Treponema sp.]